MRYLLGFSVIAMSVASVASAAPQAPAQGEDLLTGKPARTLYICEDSAATRRAFARTFGSVEFVTAEMARSATGDWTAPKCITQSEARRLNERLSAR